MKVKLVCHGMMLFWYRGDADPAKDRYSILIPQGLHNGMYMHEVRFGVGAGAPGPKTSLMYDPTSTRPVVPQKQFRLDFGVAKNERGIRPNPQENLSFYPKGNAKAVANAAGVAFSIDVPYPHSQKPVRVATYCADPYACDPDKDTVDIGVKKLGITPRRIVGARLLTYEVADPSQAITLVETTGSDKFVIVPGPLTDDVTLHLYSQPSVLQSPKGHLDLLNAMLDVDDGEGNVNPLDLRMNEYCDATIDPDSFGMTPELGFKDHLHLWEYKALHTRSPSTPSREHSHVDAGSNEVQVLFVNPAECGQGGGC